MKDRILNFTVKKQTIVLIATLAIVSAYIGERYQPFQLVSNVGEYTAEQVEQAGSAPKFEYSNTSNKGQVSRVKTYTVQKGDTLWSLTREFGIHLEAFKLYNQSIADDNKIYPGQVLKIPPKV
jgi:LysM repeat protein